jgi:MATE family multidrug resistance protein
MHDPTPPFVPEPHGLRQELVATLRLAVPVVVVQVGLMAMGVVDTMMVGRVSARAIAAVALGNIYVITVAMLGAGILMVLDPLVSQAVGAQDHPAIARAVQRGFVLAAVLGLPCSLALLPAAPLLTLLRQAPDVVPDAATYVRIAATAQLPFLAFIVLRHSLQAMHRLAPLVWVIVAANLLNVVLDWMLIFGRLGAPAMGVAGAAWATVIGRWVMAAGLLVLGWRTLRPYLRPWRADAFQAGPLWRMVAVGAPIGIQIQLEYGVFAVVGLIMGNLGAVPMAGHQIALNLASLTYMMPLGVSTASAILVGNAVGRGDSTEARRAARAGLIIGVGIMLLNAALFLGAPGLVARAYTTDAAVIAVAALLIPLAGVFQVFDGTQVVSIGILRGVADTRTPMLVNLLGYWVIGLPVGAWLGLRLGWGPRGLWWGLVVGLVVVALVLLARVRVRLSGDLARLRV